MIFYLGVVRRGLTAPPAPSAAPVAAANDKDKKDKDKDKKKDAKNATPPPPAPSYPFEDAQMFDAKPAPGQPLRILRGIGVPPGNYDLYVVLHERA